MRELPLLLAGEVGEDSAPERTLPASTSRVLGRGKDELLLDILLLDEAVDMASSNTVSSTVSSPVSSSWVMVETDVILSEGGSAFLAWAERRDVLGVDKGVILVPLGRVLEILEEDVDVLEGGLGLGVLRALLLPMSRLVARGELMPRPRGRVLDRSGTGEAVLRRPRVLVLETGGRREGLLFPETGYVERYSGKIESRGESRGVT